MDIDFPVVLRALGPLESIIQAAGRCNREGRQELGRVVVFNPTDGHVPRGAYGTATDETRTLLASGEINPNDSAAVSAYYRKLFGTASSPGTLDTDSLKIQGMRRELHYPKVANRFRMVDDDTMSVVILTYPGPGQNLAILGLLDRLRAPHPADAREVLRKLQPYIVSIRRPEAAGLQEQGLITPLLGGAIGEWHGNYDPIRGIVASDPDYIF